jgi:quercetin dioxygenase-like cupin family protein
MHSRNKWAALATATLCAAAIASHARTLGNNPGPSSITVERAHIAFSHALPVMDAHNLKETIVEVTYAPGESSAPHSHPCPVVGYVLQGTLRTQVQGEPPALYKPGQTFYEAPNSVHQISANDSQMEPAKFLAVFVCDHETPLSTDTPKSMPAGGR